MWAALHFCLKITVSEKAHNPLQNIQYLQRFKYLNYVLFFSSGCIRVISGTTKSPEKSTKKQQIIVLQKVLDSSSNMHVCMHMCTCTHTSASHELFKKHLHNLLTLSIIPKYKSKIIPKQIHPFETVELANKNPEWQDWRMSTAKLITSLPFCLFCRYNELKGLRERTKTRKVVSFNLRQFPSNHFIPNLLRAPSQPLQ